MGINLLEPITHILLQTIAAQGSHQKQKGGGWKGQPSSQTFCGKSMCLKEGRSVGAACPKQFFVKKFVLQVHEQYFSFKMVLMLQTIKTIGSHLPTHPLLFFFKFLIYRNFPGNSFCTFKLLTSKCPTSVRSEPNLSVQTFCIHTSLKLSNISQFFFWLLLLMCVLFFVKIRIGKGISVSKSNESPHVTKGAFCLTHPAQLPPPSIGIGNKKHFQFRHQSYFSRGEVILVQQIFKRLS